MTTLFAPARADCRTPDPMPVLRHPRENRTLGLAVLTIAVLLTRLIGAFVLPVYDDAFITYRYAENLINGHGFVYNAEEHVLGTTAPLFGLLAAGFRALGAQLVYAIPIFNAFCDAAIVAITGMLLAESYGLVAATVFGLAFAASPMLVRIAVGGMEANFFLLATLATILLFTRGHKRWAVVLASLSYFLRPEAVLTVALFCASEAYARRWKSAVALGFLSLGIVAGPLAVIYSIYGSILPQSVIAKAHSSPLPLFAVARRLVVPNAASLALLLVALAGVPRLVRARGALGMLMIWVSLYIGAYVAARPQVWSWYSEPVQYVLALLAGVAIAALLGRVTGLERARWLSPTTIAGGALVVAAWGGILVVQGPSGVTRHVYGEMAEMFASPSLEDATILAEDIGAVGYYSEAHIVDAAGLITPAALRYRNLPDKVRAFSPDYLLLNAMRPELEMMADAWMASRYVALKRLSPNGDTTIYADPQRYPREWTQGYIWYGRRAPAPHAALDSVTPPAVR